MSSVYFALNPQTGLIKIGSSRSINRRLKGLKHDVGAPVEILAAAPGTLYDEYKIHRLFYGQIAHGEWFHPSDDLWNLISTVRFFGDLPEKCRGQQFDNSRAIPGEKSPRPHAKMSRETRQNMSRAANARWARHRSAQQVAA